MARFWVSWQSRVYAKTVPFQIWVEDGPGSKFNFYAVLDSDQLHLIFQTLEHLYPDRIDLCLHQKDPGWFPDPTRFPNFQNRTSLTGGLSRAEP